MLGKCNLEGRVALGAEIMVLCSIRWFFLYYWRELDLGWSFPILASVFVMSNNDIFCCFLRTPMLSVYCPVILSRLLHECVTAFLYQCIHFGIYIYECVTAV